MLTLNYNASSTRIVGLSNDQRSRLRSFLSFVDSKKEYVCRMRNMPTPFVYLLQRDSFPSGLLELVLKYFQRNEWSYQVKGAAQPGSPQTVELPDWLYPHQPKAIRAAWEKPRGVICSPTGSGKTTMAAFYTSAFPDCRVLITVPTLDLLRQTVEAFERLLKEPIGQLSGRKREWQRITVGVINTVHERREQFRAELNSIDIVIIDECHRTPVRRYKEVLASCPSAHRRVGLSATPYRNSGEDLMTEGLLGPMVYRVTEDEVTQTGLILQPTVLFVPVKEPNVKYTRNAVKDSSGTVIYETFNGKPERDEVYTKAIVENKDRNRTVVEMAKAFHCSTTTGSMVIIVQLIEHGEILREMLQDAGFEVPFINGGQTSKEERENRHAVINALKNEELRLAIASSILNEGVDIPPLRVIINAGGGSSDRTVLQQLGRVVRTSPGKKTALYLDFDDEEPNYLFRNSRERKEAIESRFPGVVKTASTKKVLSLLANLTA